MTFTFKLSKRLAQAYAAVAAALTLSACGDFTVTTPVSGSSQAPVQSIAIAPDAATVAAGATIQLAAELRDSLGELVTARAVVWSSDAPLVALVSATGEVRGLAAGTAKITAESEGRRGTASVSVGPGGSVPSGRSGYFAAPNGSAGAEGSRDHPWDLPTALSGGGGRVQPGDTVWLRGGTYRGLFRSTLTGESGRPIVVRQYPGERAILDAATSGDGSGLNVRGAWTVFWGFELTNSNTARTASATGGHYRPHGLTNYASHTKYVNLVVHDAGVAFYTEPEYVDVEISGCIFYNNGWQGPLRGAGHALYLKSDNGPVVVRDNVMFNQFGYGVHVYTDRGSGKLNNILLERNVAFNNGALSDRSYAANILVGGEDYATGDVVKDNITYFSPTVGGWNLRIGYGAVENGSIELRGNHVVGGSTALELGNWKSATVSGNRFIDADTMVALLDGSPAGHTWSGNVHQRDPAARAWIRTASSYTFTGWRSATGLALTDQTQTGPPGATDVVVRQNPYERGRATIVVLNWTRQSAAAAIPQGVLSPGDRYEVRNIQRLFGSPIASGTFTGAPILLPMTGVAPPTPVGRSSSRAPKTGPDFDVFILTKVEP